MFLALRAVVSLQVKVSYVAALILSRSLSDRDCNAKCVIGITRIYVCRSRPCPLLHACPPTLPSPACNVKFSIAIENFTRICRQNRLESIQGPFNA